MLRLLLVLLALLPAIPRAATTLWLQSSSSPETRFTAPTDSFQFSGLSSTGIALTVTPASGNTVSLTIQPPPGQSLSPGAYEMATEMASTPRATLQMISGSSWICNNDGGRFVVLELAYDGNLNVVSLAVDFELRCKVGPVVYGELRYGSSLPVTADKPVSATTPDAFAFFAQALLSPGTIATSNPTTIYGIRSPAALSIVGGEYSINGAPFTSAPGSIGNRDRVTLRQTASAQYGATTSATLNVGGVSSSFEATTFMPGVPFTAVSMDSPTPNTFGTASRLDAKPPDWAITTRPTDGNSLTVDLRSPDGSFSSITFAAPLDAPLGVGPYEATTQFPPYGASPGLAALGGFTCSATEGRFVIHDIAIEANTVTRLAASFEQWCFSGGPIYGEVRINSSMPLPSMAISPRTSPYPFALLAPSPVRAGALVQSNLTSIDGIDVPVPLSIVGGEYSLNGAPFTSAPGMANPRDDVVVRLTASRTPGGTRSATLTAGGRSATLSATTYLPGMSLSGLYYQSSTGDYIGGGLTRLFLAPPNRLTRTPAYGPWQVQEKLDAMHGEWWYATFVAPQGAQLLAGTYENANRWPFQDASVPGLDFSGDGRGCNQVYGRFVVRDAQYTWDGILQRLAVDFEQHCEIPTAPPLFGELRVNTTVPFSALEGGACTADDPACVADLAITQAVDPPSPRVGQDTTFSVTVTNRGPATAHTVLVSDVLPDGVQLVSAPPACNGSGGAMTCTMAAIAVDASVRLDFVVRPAQPMTMANAAGVSAEEFDLATADNQSVAFANVVGAASVSGLSTRADVLSGDSVLIAGFVIGGTQNKTVVVRARGPSLATAGVANFLPDPKLQVVRAPDQLPIDGNDDWGAANNASAIATSGFAPLDPHESALLLVLSPGVYTAIVSSSGPNGVGIVEVFEVDHPESPLVGISTRGQVLRGDDVMIAGFVVAGSAPQTFAVRARGPSLAAAGVSGTLADPTLQLVRASDGLVVAANDDWSTDASAAQLVASGFAPSQDKEAAVLVTLQPGAYTAIMRGANSSVGVGIVEVYAVP